MLNKEDVACKKPLENKIKNRCIHVVKLIGEIFGNKIKNVCFSERDVDDVPNKLHFEASLNKPMTTSEWDYSCSFPSKFLFMKDDELVKEIKEQILKDNSKESKKMEILEKLTPEEMKFLGLDEGIKNE